VVSQRFCHHPYPHPHPSYQHPHPHPHHYHILKIVLGRRTQNIVVQSLLGGTIVNLYLWFQVRSVIRQRFSRWQEGRTIATRYTRTSIATNADTPGDPHKAGSTRRGSAASITRDYMTNNNTNGVHGHMTIPMLSLNDEAL
jgi:hypothetical protein